MGQMQSLVQDMQSHYKALKSLTKGPNFDRDAIGKEALAVYNDVEELEKLRKQAFHIIKQKDKADLSNQLLNSCSVRVRPARAVYSNLHEEPQIAHQRALTDEHDRLNYGHSVENRYFLASGTAFS